MKKKLLIVVDMQNDFIDGSLGTKEAQAIVDKVENYVKNFDGDVIFTLDTHNEDYLNTQEGKKLPVKHCIQHTHGWNITEKLSKYANWTVVKPTFGSTYLTKIVGDDDYTEIELCGLCTDICVVSNALLLKANFPEIPISVHKDLCAGVTPESHEAALTTMKMCQINII